MSGPATVDVAIVDDHGLIARTLATALELRGTAAAIVDPQAPLPVVDAVLATGAAMVLLDLDLGGGLDGQGLIAPLVDAGRRVVVLTGVEDAGRLVACLDAGAAAVLSKAGSFDRLVDAVDLAAHGLTVMHPGEVAELRARAGDTARDERARLADFDTLTDREAHVLAGLLRGASAADIAAESFVAVATVRSQISAVLRKLGVPSALAAVARARDAGWEPPGDV